MLKQYSFIIKSIKQDTESYVLNNIVYHGSPDKLSIIKGSKTRKSKRFNYNCVFVTPFKYMASHFIIEKETVFNEVLKRYPYIKKSFYTIGGGYPTSYYEQFSNRCKTDKSFKHKAQTTCAKKTVMYVVVQDKDHNFMEFEDFDMNYTGYIHYIDYNQYKDNSFQDHDYPFEFVVKGNVKPFKVEKINVDFTIKCFRK